MRVRNFLNRPIESQPADQGLDWVFRLRSGVRHAGSGFTGSENTQVLISVHPGPQLASREGREEGREEDASRKRADQWWFKFDCARKGCKWGHLA
jgi:hypothetical protein